MKSWNRYVLASALLLFSASLSAMAMVETDVRDSTAARTRTILADETGVPMFDIIFQTTVPGEKRSIRSKVVASQPSTTSDAVLMVAVSVSLLLFPTDYVG